MPIGIVSEPCLALIRGSNLLAGIWLKYHSPLHLSFNPTLHNHRNVSLPEEQLDAPLGYFPSQPGHTLKDGTWTITRKLGWGPRSSTWLFTDKNDQHRALKILTTTATADPNAKNEYLRYKERGMREINISLFNRSLLIAYNISTKTNKRPVINNDA